MIDVLLITEYYRAGRKEWGVSNTEHNYLGSLECTSFVNVRARYYDRDEYTDGNLLTECLCNPPNVIVFSETSHSKLNPDYVTLACITRTLKIPIIMLWCDSDKDDIFMMEGKYPFVSLHALFDHFDPTPYTKTPHRYLGIFCPQDPRWLYQDNRPRDIPVSFAGSRSNDGDRRGHIDTIEEAGILVYTRGGRGEDDLSMQEYTDIYRRSLITLNFSRPDALKGRLFEATMCGALLMEPAHTHYYRYYNAGSEVVVYSGKTDLVEKVKYYLEHDNERKTIAEAGYLRSREWNNGVFWSTVFRRIGLSI